MVNPIMEVETQPIASSHEVKHTKIKNTKTTIIIISKTGELTECVVEPATETTLEELTIILSKKCGYRNHNGFGCYHTFKYKNKKKFALKDGAIFKYIYVDVWGKTDGRPGCENKYEMPPPIDELLFYGNIALIARSDKETTINFTVELWNKIYEKLFGGFEDLSATIAEDENEIDELDNIPSHKKTANGYLKDGFIVDDDSEDKTPRCKKNTRGRCKKNKSESTESEFITETETESATPPSESDADADADVEICPPVIECNIKKKPKTVAPNRPKRTATKSKNIVEETTVAQESESELSEEEYI